MKSITLMNISQIFRKSDKLDEANETEILLGISFINSKKPQQAAEIFK